ncbi:hypothetical protein C8R45DRAFT_931028 [Mycena sanguinolenta]|nr:hypothetical protein C8R45DRAFT_931028 [Mycena sanguinolenta]
MCSDPICIAKGTLSSPFTPLCTQFIAIFQCPNFGVLYAIPLLYPSTNLAFKSSVLLTLLCRVRNSNTINWGGYVDYACYEAYGYDNSHRYATGTMGVYEGKTAPPTFL